MENRNSFILYTDTYEAIKDLTPDEKGSLLDAIYLYAMGEDVELPKGEASMAWKFIRIALDRNDEKWYTIKAKRAEAGAKGAAARWGNDGKDGKNGKCHQDMANDGKDGC